jgi:flagellar FliL protein
MAVKDAKPVAPEGEAPRKGKKLLIIVLAAAVLVVVLLAAVAILLLQGGSDESEGDEEEAQEIQATTKKKGGHGVPPVFVALDPFTVNLAPEEHGSGQYMQVTLSLEVDDLEEDARLKAWMPRIRNDVTLIMSGKKESELMTKEGKAALAQEIQDGINAIVSPPPKKGKAPDGPVRAVLFTQIIIQ